jgi:hypothetical protein
MKWMKRKKPFKGLEDHLLSDRATKLSKNGWFTFFTIRRGQRKPEGFDITTNYFVKLFVELRDS